MILGEEEGDEPVILTDILGLEDALGTMDFKVRWPVWKCVQRVEGPSHPGALIPS